MIIYVYDINTLNLIAKPQVKDYETLKKILLDFIQNGIYKII